MKSGVEMALSDGLQELCILFKQKMIEVPDDQIDEIVKEAKQEAIVKAKTIIENAITQAILERALGDIAFKRGESTPGANEASAGSVALSAEEACSADEQIREEIRRIKQEIATNEAQLGNVAESSDNTEIASGCYVYAIIGNNGDLLLQNLAGKGIDHDAPIYCVSHQDIQAVVSNVSLDEFGEEALDSNINDTEWLMEKAQLHQSALSELSTVRTVIPMRFCTIYSDERRVQEMLAQHYDGFASALVRLENKQEWGVKVYCASPVLRDRVAEISDVVKSLNSEISEKSEAAAYFTKKKIDDAISAESERISDEVVQDSHNSLWMRSWEAVVNPLQGRDVTHREEDMVLNGAYLISRDCVEAFQTELADLRGKYAGLGFSYELSGPWPPYNFATATAGEDSVDEPVCA